jgi:hypothetical protein
MAYILLRARKRQQGCRTTKLVLDSPRHAISPILDV